MQHCLFRKVSTDFYFGTLFLGQTNTDYIDIRRARLFIVVFCLNGMIYMFASYIQNVKCLASHYRGY